MMRSYEEKLGMIRRFGRIRESAARLREIAASDGIPETASEKISQIANAICKDLES